jgi:hypothetical protein
MISLPSFRQSLLLVSFCVVVSADLWNITTDPLPPLQPQECGYQTYNSQIYTNSSGDIVLNVQLPGYIFSSYAYQFQQATATGDNAGVPIYQLAFTNYTSQMGLLVEYNSQECLESGVEGGSAFPGYAYYQNMIVDLYDQGIPIDFEYVTEPVYGLCLKYSAEVPWNNPALPRNITYTTVFQNSTGYLITYSLVGTEYCCYDTKNLYCPNAGLCTDGSSPGLTYAATNQSISGYQLFTKDSWPPGFFSQYCPFSSVSPDSSSCTTTDDQVMENYKISTIVFATLFGVLLFVLIGITFIYPFMQKRMRKDDTVSLV